MSVEADLFLKSHPEITTIEALLPDCNGVMRGKWLPRHKLAKVFQGEFKLPVTALSLDIWGRDVEELVFESGDADGICRPIEGSLLPTPWVSDNSYGQVMLSLYTPDGEPYPGDPRHVLRNVLTRFHNAGWRPVVAAELEFSLVHYDRRGIQHSCPVPVGQDPIGGNTYGLDVLQNNAALLDDIRSACETQSLPFDGIVKESAPSQYEINMQHVDNPVLAADQIQLMKRLIKGVAGKHGLVASFMAKPFENEAGNGMHVHCSVLDEQGDNVFDDGGEPGHRAAAPGNCRLHALHGRIHGHIRTQLQFLPALPARRPRAHLALLGLRESHGVAANTRRQSAARRLEHRVSGADANPYLVFAAAELHPRRYCPASWTRAPHRGRRLRAGRGRAAAIPPGGAQAVRVLGIHPAQPGAGIAAHLRPEQMAGKRRVSQQGQRVGIPVLPGTTLTGQHPAQYPFSIFTTDSSGSPAA